MGRIPSKQIQRDPLHRQRSHRLKRYGAKDQSYAPHCSVSAATAKKYIGQNLKTAGNAQKVTQNGYKDVLVNNMVCKIL